MSIEDFQTLSLCASVRSKRSLRRVRRVRCEEHGLPIHGLILGIEASLSAERLRITITVRPTTSQAVPIAFGFHLYLRLPGVPRADWQVTLPLRRHLVRDERGIPTGTGARWPATRFRLADCGFDDGYDGLAARSTFCVAGGGRTLAVDLQSGYPAAGVLAAGRELHLLRADDRSDERAP